MIHLDILRFPELKLFQGLINPGHEELWDRNNRGAESIPRLEELSDYRTSGTG